MLLLAVLSSTAQSITPHGPLPSERQLAWHQLEYYLFVHFGPNTFTDLEWGEGTEKEEIFNPEQLDCRQWCRIAKAAGAKGIIITAKHHDGFCLWPSEFSSHTVKQSKWRNGKGDVLKELAEACRASGLKLGIYLSPWDRNHPKYGTYEYNVVFANMMKEVVRRYGPLFEFWWDGANGEGPNGKRQVYDWKNFEQTLRSAAPNTPVFSDIGPDIRWVGNEKGFAGETNWNLLDTAGYTRGAGAPAAKSLNEGNQNGRVWIPAECDVSIRPGWFYHQKEDAQVKTAEQLFSLYLRSVGRGAALLLNVPPDRRGLFTAFDSAALVNFKKLRDENFKTSLLKQSGVIVKAPGFNNAAQLLTDKNTGSFISLQDSSASLAIQFPQPTPVNCIILQEPLQMGQRIKSLLIEIHNQDGSVNKIIKTTVGHKRLITFQKEVATSMRIFITDSKATPLICEADAYYINESLIEK